MNRSGSKQDLIERVATEIAQSGLPVSSQPVVIGVSGGVDSMTLLWILADVLKLRTIALHVNYKKRGAASDADEALVRSFCMNREIICEVHPGTTASLPVTGASDGQTAEQSATRESIPGHSGTGNFQEQARDLRRNLLLEAMHNHRACGIFQAHHRDDQTETIVQKILRGSAPEKWAGMKRADPPWFRPLLDVSKKELLDFAGEHDVPFRTDASNLESSYARNILRNDIFPVLDASFPGWRRNMDRLSRAGRHHQELLDHVTAHATMRLNPDCGESKSSAGDAQRVETAPPAVLVRAAWLTLPPALKIPVARNWFAGQTGYRGWSEGEVQRLADLAKLSTGRRMVLGPGMEILRDRNHFVVGTHDPPEIHHVLHCTQITGSPVTLEGNVFSFDRYRFDRNGRALQLHFVGLPAKLILRNWHPGDRIQPLGMEGSQLLSDLLTNKKVSASQKKHTLVLVSFDGKVHAVIFPHRLDSGEIGAIAEYCRCRSDGQPVLLINKPDHHS